MLKMEMEMEWVYAGQKQPYLESPSDGPLMAAKTPPERDTCGVGQGRE